MNRAFPPNAIVRHYPNGIPQEAIVLPEDDLRDVLMRACAERGVLCSERFYWVTRMMDLLECAEVETVRDFLEGTWSVDSRLRSFGYGHITPSTIKMLNRLCCDALFAAGERAGRAEAMRAVRDTVSSRSVDAASLESDGVASLESGESG